MVIDETIRMLTEWCPQLKDATFLKEHPHIVDIMAFLNDASQASYYVRRCYPPLNDLGVTNVMGFVDLLSQGKPEAIRLYETVKKEFGF